MRQTPLLLLFLAASLRGASGSTKANFNQKRLLRPTDATLVKPFHFHQQLLICNAYPSKSPIIIKKNEHEVIADEQHGIAFQECRYMKSHVQTHDKLDLTVKDIEMHGTFDVGDLPTSDAVLLLVLSKRGSSPLISFQSFAFPANVTNQDAQLAVIDAYTGNSSAPQLKVEDRINVKGKQVSSKRTEKMHFNRVYAVEGGSYEACVEDRAADEVSEANLEARTKTELSLLKNQNFIVIRTGDDQNFPQSLVVFPKIQIGSSFTAKCNVWMTLFLLTCMLWL